MTPAPKPLPDAETYDTGTREEEAAAFAGYNRAAALAYARARWTRVASDNYIGVTSSPGYVAVPAATTFVRTTAADPATEVARRPGQPDIPKAELEDCAHFISCCIGQPPGGTGGGLVIGRDFPNAVYGIISANRLYEDLKAKGFITIVGTARLTGPQAAARLAAAEIAAGDLIFCHFGGAAAVGHAALYLAGAGKRIACHTYCRCDQADDYNQAWDSVNGATGYTLAKVN